MQKYYTTINLRTKYFTDLIQAMFFCNEYEKRTGKRLSVVKTIKYKTALKYNIN